MQSDFERIAIVNRGEPAMRLVHAVREYNLEHGARLRTIALFTEPDRDAMFVREADDAFDLGPATYVDPRDGERKSGYLNYAGLEEALRATRAEAVWVGWGFVAEHAAFVDLCERLGIVFIGPSAAMMRRLGDKITSKRLAEAAEVPVAPWSGGPVATVEEARRHAERIGYPLMIKATAGGGGRGIRKVMDETDLEEAFESARSEALKAFGDPTVFMERLVTEARHVEVQIIGDHHGTIWALGVRDCTLQRRHQKLLEETPSPALSPALDRSLREAAVRLGHVVGYRNAGTVEFLYEPAREAFSFMEVNARLQVEHPVTEMTTGVDLVKLQIHVARGGRLDGNPPGPQGHAIEVRLNAEDPDNRFAPAPGVVSVFRMPHGPGLRVDTGLEPGDAIAPEFDSMIAKIIAFGRDREEALARMRRALAESSILIRGGTSNKGFLLELLRKPEVASGAYDVGWVDRQVSAGAFTSTRFAEVALLDAAVEAYEAETAVDRARFFDTAARGRATVPDDAGKSVTLGYRGLSYAMEVHRLGPERYRINVEDRRIDVRVTPGGRSERRLTIGARHYRVISAVDGPMHFVEVNGVPHRITHDEGGLVRAPAPSVVVSVEVAEGDPVQPGDRLAVLEAMKMEMSVRAEYAGTVEAVLVRSNEQVCAGAPLIRIEPAADAPRPADAEPVSFDALGIPMPTRRPLYDRCEDNFEAMRSLMLGYDVDARMLRRIDAERSAICEDLPPDHELVCRHEMEILRLFVDLNALFHRRPAGATEGERLGTADYMLSYLRNLDAGAASLPSGFLEKLERALAHYGVTSLDPTPALEESLFRIHKAHLHVERQVEPALHILERRLDHADALAPSATPAFAALLDRLIAETQGRFPTLNDVAREVRYRFFERPLLRQAVARTYEEANARLDALTARPDGDAQAAHIAALVQCPQALSSTIMRRMPAVSTDVRRTFLEIMTRRYYRIRALTNVHTTTVDGQAFAQAEYDHEGRRLHVLTTHAGYEDFVGAAEKMGPLLAAIPAHDDVVVDFYLWREDLPEAPESLLGEVLRSVNTVAFPRRLRRIVAAVSGPEAGTGIGGVRHFTFRPSEDGYHEERFYRGVHPMIAKRLHLWRLSNFEIERLPSPEDVYLLRVTARENPKDERLVGVAEVRDLTPIRDEAGRITHLPQLERMLLEVVYGLRHVQAHRPPRRRLYWNRILLYVWPPFDLGSEALNLLVHRLMPVTEGLGLEALILQTRIPRPDGTLKPTRIHIENIGRSGWTLTFREPPTEPIATLDEYTQKVVRLKRRGLIYPYELIRMLTPADNGAPAGFPPGTFREYDLDEAGRLAPVDRPFGQNTANVVVGEITHCTPKYPEGMTRVALLSDPTHGMGSLSEAECRRIIGALDLAEAKGLPVEWYAVSAGAKIAMDSGTENMDWIAAVLRRLVTFTQAGGEVNLLVLGVNVGAQPYWNAEATMLMHTRGILVMTPQAAMVLTGKQALDYSGGVSAEDNLGIGGYERIMGPNGQAQYFAHDAAEACRILLRHYDHTYVVPGERFPRRAVTEDPAERDVCRYPHGRIDGAHFDTVGDVFSDEKNPGRKKPFDIRTVMRATIDQDHEPLERWYGMHDAEIGVVWDAHLGGYPVCLIGIESRPLSRLGFPPAYGPSRWTSGTLFPLASKKIARAINAACGNRPVVILANLSGFDGSPESMRNGQLEFGAEIGRAVVNFKGPLVFCVISRYHGGAFVVFSNALNDNLHVAALEGTYASVIGGAPAAAVVFAREVKRLTEQDARVTALREEATRATGSEKAKLLSRLERTVAEVYAEKLGEVAETFDGIHTVYRAQKVGSVHTIIPPERMRPHLIEAIEKGMAKELARRQTTLEPA